MYQGYSTVYNIGCTRDTVLFTVQGVPGDTVLFTLQSVPGDTVLLTTSTGCTRGYSTVNNQYRVIRIKLILEKFSKIPVIDEKMTQYFYFFLFNVRKSKRGKASESCKHVRNKLVSPSFTTLQAFLPSRKIIRLIVN